MTNMTGRLYTTLLLLLLQLFIYSGFGDTYTSSDTAWCMRCLCDDASAAATVGVEGMRAFHENEASSIARFYDCVSDKLSIAAYKRIILAQDMGAKHENSVRRRDGDNICIVTYSTFNIRSYATYSFAINGIFSYINDYRLFWTDEKTNTGANNQPNQYDTNDQRWNKVKIVWDMLEDSFLDPYCQYLVWADADLIFMNFLDFDFRKLIAKYPLANFIASRDPTIENGIINSGCFIVKRGTWAKRFFNSWWNLYDRAQGMDQHVFDKLWKIKSLDCLSNIVLLPANSINSHIPPWINQLSNDSVLHLAGASDLYRKTVFKKGFSVACNYFSHREGDHNRSLYSQLGLSKDVLLDIHLNLPFSEQVNEINSSLEGLHSNIRLVKLEDILRLKSKFRNLLQSGFGSVSSSSSENDINDNSSNRHNHHHIKVVQIKIKDTLILIYRTLQLKYDTYMTSRRGDNVNTNMNVNGGIAIDDEGAGGGGIKNSVQIELLQQLVDSAFNLVTFNYIDMSKEYCTTFIDLLVGLDTYVDQMAKLAKPQSRGVAFYYKFKLYEFVANLYIYASGANSDEISGISSSIGFDHYQSSEFNKKSKVKVNNADMQDIDYFGRRYLEFLSRSIAVWDDSLEKLNFFGSGNNVADPYKEIIVILIQYAEGLCDYFSGNLFSGDNHIISKLPTREEAISRCLGYLDRIWKTSIDEARINSLICREGRGGLEEEEGDEKEKQFVSIPERMLHNIPDYVFSSYFKLLSMRESKEEECLAFYYSVSCILPTSFFDDNGNSNGNGNGSKDNKKNNEKMGKEVCTREKSASRGCITGAATTTATTTATSTATATTSSTAPTDNDANDHENQSTSKSPKYNVLNPRREARREEVEELNNGNSIRIENGIDAISKEAKKVVFRRRIRRDSNK